MATDKQLAALKSFAPGESGNPGGKPKGARNRLTSRFIHQLADSFELEGKSAIDKLIVADPGRYLTIIASLVPKEVEISRPLGDLTDDELAKLGDLLLTALAPDEIREGDTGGSGVSTQH